MVRIEVVAESLKKAISEGSVTQLNQLIVSGLTPQQFSQLDVIPDMKGHQLSYHAKITLKTIDPTFVIYLFDRFGYEAQYRTSNLVGLIMSVPEAFDHALKAGFSSSEYLKSSWLLATYLNHVELEHKDRWDYRREYLVRKLIEAHFPLFEEGWIVLINFFSNLELAKLIFTSYQMSVTLNAFLESMPDVTRRRFISNMIGYHHHLTYLNEFGLTAVQMTQLNFFWIALEDHTDRMSYLIKDHIRPSLQPPSNVKELLDIRVLGDDTFTKVLVEIVRDYRHRSWLSFETIQFSRVLVAYSLKSKFFSAREVRIMMRSTNRALKKQLDSVVTEFESYET